ncbi:hypothetical protein [Streptomyces fuscichromogenes]|uniref:Lipoprotein n=1 Tax=Streptomyces fuscichromogenes TaxID=1324013 RepID=A0A917XKM3_9ACTN|nr:hypothetical protein [Streptomyces fuscichromogenes]GGN32234.1 hypothetical protein GCM10011578_070740 [Streptomyces fuscichromogenes]
MIPRRIGPSLAAGLVSAVLLTACGSSNGSGTADAAPTTPAASAAPATSAATAASDPAAATPAVSDSPGAGQPATTAAVLTRSVDGLGNIVTDDKGLTLYRYDKDQPNPSKWTCSGTCTKTWLPVIVPESVQTYGVEKSLLGTVHRNGETQLTLAGWPLYRYVGDTTVGQTNGQGKDGEWFAVTPAGQKSTAAG